MGNLFRVNSSKADPDILYIVDRTAVMEHRSNINAASVENPLLRQTKAWKNGRVIFVDADAWYTTAAKPNLTQNSDGRCEKRLSINFWAHHLVKFYSINFHYFAMNFKQIVNKNESKH